MIEFIKRLILTIVGKASTVLALLCFAWLVTLWAFPTATKALNPFTTPDHYEEDFARLNDELSRAQLKAFADSADFAKASRLMREQFGSEVQAGLDSIAKLKRLVALGSGRGTVDHGATVQADSTGTGSDAWLNYKIARAGGYGEPPFTLHYRFTFEVADITARFQGDDGRASEIYSVFLRSTKDPKKIMRLNYWREQVERIAEMPGEVPALRWELAPNIDFAWAGRLEAALSVSLAAFGSTQAPNDVAARFPELGAASDLKEWMQLFVGARVNIGHWLPFFSDLYVSGKYAFGIGQAPGGFIIGIGTTL